MTGVHENKAKEWEKVKPWLLDLRRHRISPVLVHHSGYDLSHMRGTFEPGKTPLPGSSAWTPRRMITKLGRKVHFPFYE